MYIIFTSIPHNINKPIALLRFDNPSPSMSDGELALCEYGCVGCHWAKILVAIYITSLQIMYLLTLSYFSNVRLTVYSTSILKLYT